MRLLHARKPGDCQLARENSDRGQSANCRVFTGVALSAAENCSEIYLQLWPTADFTLALLSCLWKSSLIPGANFSSKGEILPFFPSGSGYNGTLHKTGGVLSVLLYFNHLSVFRAGRIHKLRGGCRFQSNCTDKPGFTDA